VAPSGESLVALRRNAVYNAFWQLIQDVQRVAQMPASPTR